MSLIDWLNTEQLPKQAIHSFKRILLVAEGPNGNNGEYCNYGYSEIALVFISRECNDDNVVEWDDLLDFNTEPKRYKVATETEKQSDTFRFVNIREDVEELKAEAVNSQFWLLSFHNHGTGTTQCFIDLRTFIEEDKMIISLLDTGVYITGVKKNYPSYENVLNGVSTAAFIAVVCSAFDFATQKATALDSIVKLFSTIKDNNESNIPSGATPTNDEVEKWQAYENLNASNYRNLFNDETWNLIFKVFDNATFLSRFRIHKDELRKYSTA